MNILVVGGFDVTDEDAADLKTYAQALGREIIRQGHTLLNGSQTDFDSVVAKAASDELINVVSPKEQRVVSYVLAGTKPVHTYGRILNSRLTSWDPGEGALFAPEPIQRADVIIIVRGFEGSFRAAHWADTVKKPVLPVAYFGGAGRKLYENAFDHFESRYGGRLDKSDFEELNAYGRDWPELARIVVSLAEKAATSRNVLVLMSYTTNGDIAVVLKNAYHNFELVCKEFGYRCLRVDDTNARDRILPKILEQIERAAFVIVDLTELKPNVFFELGFAEGLRKPRVVTAQENTHLPFDIKDIPVTYWNAIDMKKLHDDLATRVAVIAEEQGRAIRDIWK
jgi:hypothetical protein